jgi:UDP-N-acetylglucosamine 3-dehydrogenase
LTNGLGIAVVGAGYWGTKLAEEYLLLSRKLKDVELYAVVDSSPDRLRIIGSRFNLPSNKLVEDFGKVLRDPTVTGVHIATPNESHYELAMKAIEAGKDVLLEKPMCLRYSDAIRLARYAEKNNKVLLIGHIFRFNNAVNKLKEMIASDQVDGCRCVELRWSSFMAPPINRSIIPDLAPHPIDILNHVFEEWPSEVYAKGRSFERRKSGLEEVVYAEFDFPGDILASITLSWIHHGPRQRTIYVLGRSAAIEVEAVKQTMVKYTNGSAIKVNIEANNTIEAEIKHFVNRIRDNVPPINSPLTGVMNVKVVEAMTQSLQEDKPIKVT